jgi:hypothetical protein
VYAPPPDTPQGAPGRTTPTEGRSARLLAKVYEVEPLACAKSGSEMKVIAVIQETEEIRRILAHLVKIGRSPPVSDPMSLN